MDATIILTIISFVLALIGSFTHTTTEKANRKVPTRWGYAVIFLLVLSASFGVYTELNKLQQQKAKAATQAKKVEEQTETERQQRLLSLISVSSNFKMATYPQLDLLFRDSITEDARTIDTLANSFPGFGLKNISYLLELNPTDDK